MSLESVRVRWVEATGYLNPPQARCGHVAVAINSREVWGEEFLIVHGGINKHKEALEDLVVLQYDQEAWFQPGPAAVGPAARAFHAGAAIARRLYIFGGHVYVKQQHKLHQFNDLWVLNTDTWEWGRVEVSPDAPQPCPRDRASMVAVAPSKLLLYGGADAMNRRLDDLWLFDLELGAWREIKPQGAKPRPRCCTSLVVVENRVLMFGGDTYGVTNELWSLRGVLEGAEGDAPQWTNLTLEGPPPPPRRGHAGDELGRWVVFMGGLTEQKSMLGIKSRNEYLADVVVLDRQADGVAWRGIEAAAVGEGPVPREKHTLTSLSSGRLLMFGGTDGQTTLGDAWWLDLEDIAAPTPHTITAADLPPPPFGLTHSQQEEMGQQYQDHEYQQYQDQQQQQQYQQQYRQQAGVQPGGTVPPPAPAATTLAGGVVPAVPQQGAAGTAGPAAQQLPAGFSYLPASISTSLPAVPAGISYAFSSLRERLGLPTASSATSLTGPSVVGAELPAVRPTSNRAGSAAGTAVMPPQAPFAAQYPAAGQGLPTESDAAVAPTEDEGLLAMGERALLSEVGTEGGAATAGGVEGGGWDEQQLVQAARHFLASCRPEDLRIGDLPVLVADYRRLARVGWAMVLRDKGVEGLLQGAGGGGGEAGDLMLMPGRFLHLGAGDLRMREIPELLADYQLLLASQTPDADSE